MSTPAFALTASTPIPSLGLELRQYEHAATGARHLHFACADDNNAFMVALPTLPQDSSGVAHILEHTALCGSRRYPVRDPFFMMLRRSLNTFMNAFTSADSTAYPFATQNRKDYDNLLRVYLDAVFFPRLDPLDFAQEGWRLELKPDSAPQHPRLEFHGVVYNEMKGAMSAPLAQLYQHVHAALLPDTIYRHNSGGEPLAIPDLTHTALRDFHSRHYHPGNAVFMTYGSFPEREHQAAIESLVLAEFGRPKEVVLSTPQPHFTAPRRLDVTYHLDPDGAEEGERHTHAVWAWLLGDATAADDVVAAHVLSSVLLEHSASPLRHYLESTDLADAPSELCGIDDSARQLAFVCGVEGSEAEHADTLEAQILDVLATVARDGVEATALEAIVDRIEMAQRDIDGGGYPFGLQLMGRAMPAAMYRADPVHLLDLDRVLERLRRAIAEPDYLRQLVGRLLINNPHRVRVVMQPDAGKAAADAAREQARLDALAAGMDATKVAAVAAQSAALRARQAQVDDPNVLPRVTLADVPAASAALQPVTHSVAGLDVLEYACGANGVFRMLVAFDLPALDDEELRALPLLAEFLTEFGHGAEDYLAVQGRRALHGTFSANTMARSSVDGSSLGGWFVIGGKGLARKRGHIIEILCEMLGGVRFDEPARLRELVMQSRAEAEQSVADRGHQLAVMSAARTLGRAAALDELWDGTSALRQLKALTSGDDDTLAQLFATFARIRDKLLAAPRRVALIGDAAALADAAPRCASLALVSPAAFAGFDPQPTVESAISGWIANTQVNFCAKAYAAVAEDHPDAPLLAVLGRYLNDGFLHREIREQGGAYGSGASYDSDTATFRFYSYRDPRASATLADFDRALAWFADDRDPQRLEEAILGSIRALDQPRSPAGEAERAFTNRLYGRDDPMRARYRARVLAADHAALARVAARYLDPARGSLGAVCQAAAESEFAAAGLSLARL